jgi:hypothetical protein
MSVDQLIEMDQYNLDHIRRGLPHFTELVPSMFALYERARGLIPRQLPPLFGQTLLLCHKAFFCAAVTIGRRHPDDAAPITRRAIEAVRLAVAAKADPNLLDEWKAYTTRLARWEARARRETEGVGSERQDSPASAARAPASLSRRSLRCVCALHARICLGPTVAGAG